MKPQKIVWLFALILLVSSFQACKKDTTDDPGDTVVDKDGNVYQKITIGTQTWMVENLRTTKYRNGDPITEATDSAAWHVLTNGAYCDDNSITNYAGTYGHLYNWYAVTDTRNIAPAGWHVATDADWATLADFLGGWEIAGGQMKETGTSHWLFPNTDATNESGFTGLPGGFRYADGGFVGIVHNGKLGYWWTTAEIDAASAWFRGMTCASPYLGWESVSKNYGLSVRCVKGE
jgi:uncharacterized protein (TIGR02145 family)